MIQSIDKSTLGYSAVFNLREDTHLVGTQYSWLGSLFYLGYFFWEYPTSVMLQKLPVGTLMSVTVRRSRNNLLNLDCLLMKRGHTLGVHINVPCRMPEFLQPGCL